MSLLGDIAKLPLRWRLVEGADAQIRLICDYPYRCRIRAPCRLNEPRLAAFYLIEVITTSARPTIAASNPIQRPRGRAKIRQPDAPVVGAVPNVPPQET
jgi:hypothetical protein